MTLTSSLAKEWLNNHQELRLTERDNYVKCVKTLVSGFLDRWIIGSLWANVWSVNATQNFQKFAKYLSLCRAELISLHTIPQAVDALTRVTVNLLDITTADAVSYVEHLSVIDRSKVSAYSSALWVWHRLSKPRWQHSSIPMREGSKRSSSLEVDHTVAASLWYSKVELCWQEAVNSAKLDANSEDARVLPFNGFKNKAEAMSYINALGNCSLLEKSFNISKSDGQFWDFLSKVHEFRSDNPGRISRSDWECSLAFSPELLEPSNCSIDVIRSRIDQRDVIIRKDLIEFLRGNVVRYDV